MVEQSEKSAYKVRHLGPLHTYRGLKRDMMITVGLIILLLVLKAVGS